MPLETSHGFLFILAPVYEGTLTCVFRYIVLTDAMLTDTLFPLLIRVFVLVSSLSPCLYTSFFT